VYTLHRRPDLYGMDAECFRPERWDGDMPLFRDRTTQNYGYLPFSGGPRLCLGSKLEQFLPVVTDICVAQRADHLVSNVRGLCPNGSSLCHRAHIPALPEYPAS
jgi:hypothetical protein